MRGSYVYHYAMEAWWGLSIECPILTTRSISHRRKRSKRMFLVAEIYTRQNRSSKSYGGRKNTIPVSFSLEKQRKFVSNSKKPFKTVTHGYFEALASLVLQNAICNGFNGFFSLEKNFPCFSRKLNRKKAISSRTFFVDKNLKFQVTSTT